MKNNKKYIAYDSDKCYELDYDEEQIDISFDDFFAENGLDN